MNGFSVQDYITVGAGGVCVLLVIWIVVNDRIKLSPTLIKIQTEMALSREVIKNNTDAFKEVARSNDNVARSNDNVAQAINLFKSALENNTKMLESNGIQLSGMQNAVTRIDERTQACLKG